MLEWVSRCHIQQEELQCDLALVEWTAVTGKHGFGKTVSPAKSPCPSKRPTQLLNVEPNHFLSLSNLDGDSSAGADELSTTTALVLHHFGLGHALGDTSQDSGQGTVSKQTTSSRPSGAKSVNKQGNV